MLHVVCHHYAVSLHCVYVRSLLLYVNNNAIMLCSGSSKQFMKDAEVNEMVKLWDIKLTFGFVMLFHPCLSMFVFFSFMNV